MRIKNRRHIGKLQSIRPRARRIRYPVGGAPGPTPRCSAAARCTHRARGSAARPRTAVRTGPADSSRAPLGARHCSHAAIIQRAGAQHTLPDRYTNRRHATVCPTPLQVHHPHMLIEYTPGHQLATHRKACMSCTLTRAAAAVSTPRRGRHLRSTRGIAAALRRASAASRTGSARCGAARTCFATPQPPPRQPGSLKSVNPAPLTPDRVAVDATWCHSLEQIVQLHRLQLQPDLIQWPCGLQELHSHPRRHLPPDTAMPSSRPYTHASCAPRESASSGGQACPRARAPRLPVCVATHTIYRGVVEHTMECTHPLWLSHPSTHHAGVHASAAAQPKQTLAQHVWHSKHRHHRRSMDGLPCF